MGLSAGEINFLFVDNRTVREANRRYLRHDWTTDVLAFPTQETSRPPPVGPLEGDVMISVPTARRQARERGHSLEWELKLLCLHGLLNLLKGPRE